MGTESILYHSRMRVLQSRKSRRSHRQQGAGNYSTRTTPALPLPRLHVRQPVHKEKLVPPKEVLPRDRAFRYAYLQHHKPFGIRKIPSLNPDPDPTKEGIIERMRAAGRAKKEQEEMSMAAVVASKPAESSKKPPRMPRASSTSILMNSPTSVATLPPVVGSVVPTKAQWYSEECSSSEEEVGGSFAFLSEWSSLPSSPLVAVAKRKLPALR